MPQESSQEQEILKFIRKRDYRLVRELGRGACGKTVLLHDDMIDESFVCKKYLPYSESQRSVLFGNFVREVKLLHHVHHDNIVRLFNYYLYPEAFAGYILMEFIDGPDIEDYSTLNPDKVGDLFIQAISGFGYLEGSGILHRDVRPGNLLVDNSGRLKIIDLGFGKQIKTSADFDKSVSLNWWCDPPSDFQEGRYDFCTEVYFVGKLFERIIQEGDISQFQFLPTLQGMCQYQASSRISNFADINKTIQSGRLHEIGFNEDEIEAYRQFANSVRWHVTKIENDAKYIDDPERIQTQLGEVYRKCMLEETVADAALVLRCLISGTYYLRREGFRVSCLREFVRLLKALTAEKNRILLANLHTRLDAVPRYSDSPLYISDDDVPF